MTFFRKNLGQSGEQAAADFLHQQGYVLVETNFKTRTGEIDIVGRDKDIWCFIEVKARTSTRKGLPREAVNLRKQQKIMTTAMVYLKHHKLMDQRVRFDVVEVILGQGSGGGSWQINLIKNAFQAV